jgi:hypothetical protein
MLETSRSRDESTATELLGRAVSLAQPGGLIRLFVDLGPPIARLLERLVLDDQTSQHVARIAAAFRVDTEAKRGIPPERRARKPVLWNLFPQRNLSHGTSPKRA